jgi:hypothetical protein
VGPSNLASRHAKNVIKGNKPKNLPNLSIGVPMFCLNPVDVEYVFHFLCLWMGSSTYMPTKIVINRNLKMNNLQTRRFLSSVRTE